MMACRTANWIGHGGMLPPIAIDESGIRCFDWEWLEKAQEIAELVIEGSLSQPYGTMKHKEGGYVKIIHELTWMKRMIKETS